MGTIKLKINRHYTFRKFNNKDNTSNFLGGQGLSAF